MSENKIKFLGSSIRITQNYFKEELKAPAGRALVARKRCLRNNYFIGMKSKSIDLSRLR